MRKPHRRAGKLRPGTSELEKVRGASAVVFGGLAGALPIVEQSSFVDVGVVSFAPQRGGGQALENVSSVKSSATAASLKSPENVIAPPRSFVTSETSSSDPLASAVAPAKIDGGDLIRPLSLPPSTPPQVAMDARPQQPLNRGGNVGGGFAGSAASPAMIVTPGPDAGQVADLASGSSQSSPQAMAVLAALGGASLGVSGAPSPPPALSAHALGEPGRSARASSSPHNSEGGIPLGGGYATTGGGSQKVAGHRRSGEEAGPDASATVNSPPFLTPIVGATGSGTVSGTSKSAVSVLGTAPPSTRQPTKWSINGTASGQVVISGGGLDTDVIGTKANFGLYLSTSKGQAQLDTPVTWSANSTGPEMYSGQTLPNPSMGQWKFNNLSYNIAQQTGTGVTFDWGESLGKVTITAKLTVSNANGKSLPLTTTCMVGIVGPGWKGSINWQKSARVVNSNPCVLSYQSSQKSSQPGIKFSGLVPNNSPFTGSGTFGIVQIVQAGTTGTVSRPSPSPSGTWTAFYDETHTKLAPFPVVDVAAPGTSPIYPLQGDSPYLGLISNGTTTISDSFKDFVMYHSAIWVPVGSFVWTINATATPAAGFTHKFTVSTTKKGITSPLKISYSTWPTQWNDYSAKYLDFKKTT